MSDGNEFKGQTLNEAVRRATREYNPNFVEEKSQGRCNDLVLEISSLKSQIGRLADRSDALADQAEELRRRVGRIGRRYSGRTRCCNDWPADQKQDVTANDP